MDRDGDHRGVADLGVAMRGGGLDREGGQRGQARRVVRRLESEDRDDIAGSRLLQAAAEAPDLVGDQLQAAGGLKRCRRLHPSLQEGQLAPLPWSRRDRRPCSQSLGTIGATRRVRVSQAVPVHARAQGVAGDAERGGGAPDVAGVAAQCCLDGRAQHGLSGVPGQRTDGFAAHRPDVVGKESEHVRRALLGGREQRRTLHCVGELADVTGPVIDEQLIPGVGRQGPRRQTIVGAGASQEVLGEREDVASALAQGRQLEGDYRQTVIEVGTEGALADRTIEIDAGGRDERHVHRLRPDGPEPAHGAVLEDTEQLAL